MSFIKQTLRPQIEASNIFIGRTNELRFFVQHILKPKHPAYNIVSVWGIAGVGKSTLLARFRDEAYIAGFKDSCVMALVDARRGTPAYLMEQCAAQLRRAGYPLPSFEHVLADFKETLQRQQDERTVARSAFLRVVSELASSGVRSVPVIGGLYERVAEEARTSFWSQRGSLSVDSEAGQLRDSSGDLTRTFVEDLNWLTAAQVSSHAQRIKRGLRVILFLDGLELAATEVTDWLLGPFLQATLSKDVVLVIAGRVPIERHIPGEGIIFSMPLKEFTEDETHTYLAARGVTEADRVAAIWQLSGGLPLLLSMLACDPQGIIDTGIDVVTNVMRWIAGQGRIRERLVLHAALFSRPFMQDDLDVFHFLPEQEHTVLYRWLIGLPFIQHDPLDGRHYYHDLVQKQLIYMLSQIPAQEYQVTRLALANHYRRLLGHIEVEGGKGVYSTAEWLELALALVVQLFSLPDDASHFSAIEQVLKISYNTGQAENIIQLLRSLSQDQFESQVSVSAKRTASLLMQYFEADPASPEFLTVASDLIEVVSHAPMFSEPMLARIYSKRGMAYFAHNEHQQATADFDRALALDPEYAGAYLLRGITYSSLGAYRRAIEDFDHAQALDAREIFVYAHRGIAYRMLKEYERAIADFDRVLALDPKLDGAYLLRNLTYEKLDESRRGLGDFDHLIEQNPDNASAYMLRGMALCSLGEFERAMQNLNRAIELDSNNAQAYAGRGHVYLEMGDLRKARDDLLRSRERGPDDIDINFSLEWIGMCMEGPDPETPARLETMAAVNPHQYTAYVCRGVALLLRQRFAEALAALDQAILLDARKGEAPFWKSLACAFLKRDDEAVAALAQARTAEVPLPEVLLAPLRWLEQKRPGFYRKHVVPALETGEPSLRPV